MSDLVNFTFGPVKFSYVLAQMTCKFPIPKSLTVVRQYLNSDKTMFKLWEDKI